MCPGTSPQRNPLTLLRHFTGAVIAKPISHLHGTGEESGQGQGIVGAG